MSENNKQNQTPPPATPKEQPETAPPKPVELPKPNQGESVIKGG